MRGTMSCIKRAFFYLLLLSNRVIASLANRICTIMIILTVGDTINTTVVITTGTTASTTMFVTVILHLSLLFGLLLLMLLLF